MLNVKLLRLFEVFPFKQLIPATERFRAHIFADVVIHQVAQYTGSDQQYAHQVYIKIGFRFSDDCTGREQQAVAWQKRCHYQAGFGKNN